MYELSVENEAGEVLRLTQNPDYIITKISGLTPPGVSVNSSAVGGRDGERYNSSRMTKRNIVITLHPEDPVDQNRNRLYQYFPAKKNIRLYYKNNLRDVYIDGRVETIEGDLFSRREQMQISILCPQPYFIGKGRDGTGGVTNLPAVVPLLEFPASFPEEGLVFSELLLSERAVFTNSGAAETGAVFHFFFTGASDGVKIYDIRSGLYFGVEYEFRAYDNLYINTIPGEKSVCLKRGEEDYNLLNHRTRGSSWLPVRAGKNIFGIEAGNYHMELKWEERYEGV